MIQLIYSACNHIDNIYGMSITRSDAKKRIQGMASVIEEHVSKLAVYSDVRPNDVNGWKRTIARTLADIATIRTKPNNRHLTLRVLEDNLISGFGDDDADLFVLIDSEALKLMSDHNHDPYPDVDVTLDMVDTARDFRRMLHDACKLIAESKQDIPYGRFRSMIDKINV